MIAEPDATLLEAAVADARAGVLSIARTYNLRDLAEHHGMLAWLATAALGTDTIGDAPARSALAGHLRDALARDLLQQAATRRALDALAAAGIRAIVLKGEHVARVFYPRSHVRPRCDADLLVAPADRQAARSALERLGYVLLPHVRGDAIMAEMQFTCSAGPGAGHAIDLHWRAVTPHPFRSILPFEDAWSRSVPITALGSAARGLSSADALLLAAVHLAVHHPCDARLMWIADIDLIARTLTRVDWESFERAAAEAGVCSIAHRALETAERFFSTPLPAGQAARLEARAAAEVNAREYLVPRSRAARLLSEFRALPRWRDRAALVYQHLVPDAGYMRQRYEVDGFALAWAYVRRAANGARAWFATPLTPPRSRGQADPAPHDRHVDSTAAFR